MYQDSGDPNLRHDPTHPTANCIIPQKFSELKARWAAWIGLSVALFWAVPSSFGEAEVVLFRDRKSVV